MSLLKADTIKPVTSGGDLSLQGDSGGSAVDCLNITSAGDINFTGNTDAKIKLPSAGGIYESDGSTAVLTESGGVVSLGSAVVLPTGSLLGFAKHTYSGSTNIDIPEADTDFGTNLQITIPAGYTTADFLLVTCQIPQCFNQSYSGRRIKAGFRYATAADFGSGVGQFGPTEFLVDHIAYSSVVQDKYELLYYTVYDNVKSTSAHYIRPMLRAEGNTMKAFAVAASGGFLTAQIIKG